MLKVGDCVLQDDILPSKKETQMKIRIVFMRFKVFIIKKGPCSLDVFIGRKKHRHDLGIKVFQLGSNSVLFADTKVSISDNIPKRIMSLHFKPIFPNRTPVLVCN